MIVNDVPCKVCAFCGEQYFEGKDFESINHKLKSEIVQISIF
jgi:uncharacterized protein with PIN domain